MKAPLSPVAAGIIIAVVVVILGLFLWRGSQPPKEPEGGFQFKVDKDPAKAKQQMDDLIKQDRAAHGIK